MRRIACFGGVYNNYLALEAACEDAQQRGITNLYCLGDMGAFGPNPDKVFPILQRFGVKCLKGNYDDSVSRGLTDCQCGYTDPQDNHFARLSYDYTLKNTNEDNKRFLGTLPDNILLELEGIRILLCHGSPRRVNEFLWESNSPTHLLEMFCEQSQVDVILATHTGIHWRRELDSGRLFANVGVIGRPANDGRTNVWYTILSVDDDRSVRIEFIPLEYDYLRFAEEMRSERISEEFVESITSGWWTTCLEILPFKERVKGKH
jgi:predicted phosphodiesterase